MKRTDLTDKTFGRLKVLRRAENKNGKTMYECLCECGNKVVVYGCNLTGGKTKSCGCLSREKVSERNRNVKKNTYSIKDDVCIGIDKNGVGFRFDLDDFETVRQHQWVRNKVGYMTTTINGKKVLLHRLIIGFDTEGVIDHINRDKTDNRRCNLRACGQSENILNAKLNKNNKSGHKGVSFNKHYGKWEAFITRNYKHIYLGRYSNIEDAIEAREREEKMI